MQRELERFDFGHMDGAIAHLLS